MNENTFNTPKNWLCIDCGINTAPGLSPRSEVARMMKIAEVATNLGLEKPFLNQVVDEHSEVYMVHKAVWQKAGMEPWGGCLCIGCLEKRLGRRLTAKDFLRHHPFNTMPGTKRLLKLRVSG
jgi:hypothetical protein